MKILIANWVYNWGSTGYIIRDLKDAYIKQGHTVYIASGVNWGTPAPDAYLFCNKLSMAIYARLTNFFGATKFAGSIISTLRFLNYVRRVKPDVVHIHILNNHVLNMYWVIKYLAKNRYKTVITHHAEFYYTSCCNYSYDCNAWISDECKKCKVKHEATQAVINANPHRHWIKMSNAFEAYTPNNVIFTAVSPWVKKRSLKSPYLKRFKCEVVLNGVDNTVFKVQPEIPERLKSMLLKRKQSEYMLSVTASFAPMDKNSIKGGYFLVELAKKHKDKMFVVVATASVDANNLPENVILWGKASSQIELAQLYTHAKFTILTSRKETFSMICAESLCCGTPVIGFCAGGPESIAIAEYTKFCTFGNTFALSKTLEDWSEKSFDSKKISDEAKEIYSKERMANDYLKVYHTIVGR